MATDARSRTKIFLDAYWIPENAVDDNGYGLGMQALYAYPDYPFELELKEPSVVDVIIAIGQETSEPLMDPVSRAPYGYHDHVPCEICAVDKSDVTATKAIHEAAAEMKRILENYPTGSHRQVRRISPTTRRLGSTTVWSAKYEWSYRRDTST